MLDQNIVWLPDSTGTYAWLNHILEPEISTAALSKSDGIVSVTIKNWAGLSIEDIAFFIRVSLVDRKTKKRILPVFSNNNYISVLPGYEQTVELEFTPQDGIGLMVCVEGWNVHKQYIEIKKR